MNRYLSLVACGLLAGLAVAWAPEAAAQFGGFGLGGSPFERALQTVVDILTGTPARLTAIIAVAAFGYSMYTGNISLRWGISIILGIAIIFGAAEIVNRFAA
ncbi:MAG TPA: TrbC/VirB2 family protein [Burkholderiales bacterium]|nr:TrbC/VirB2 family protein [Burkholderiales bacterium]